MFTYMSEKMTGCRARASERLLPSMTSCLSCLLISGEMPFDSRWDMLFNATVSGMPDFSKLAICWV